MDVVRSFTRGAVTVHVLHHAAEASVTGSWLSSELLRHGYRISPGTLYPLLHRLEEAGLLTSRSDVIDGRKQRRYAITQGGRDALRKLRRAVSELAEEVLVPDGAPQATRARRRGSSTRTAR